MYRTDWKDVRVRVLIALLPGASEPTIPDGCDCMVAQLDEAGVLRVADAPAWDVLADSDLIWLESVSGSRQTDAFVPLLAAAVASELPVFSSLPLRTPLEGAEVEAADSLEEVVEGFDVMPDPPTPSRSLGRIQRYYARMARVRRYNTTDPREGILLLTEEVGELAHAMRKELELDRTRPYSNQLNVAEELADVQLFLLHLANLLEQQLDTAVREKEAKNHSRAASRFHRRNRSVPVKFLSIEGLIGAGKTTTARLVESRSTCSGVYERVESHPFIEAFYSDGLDHVLELELAFILMRWHSVRRAGEARIVSDFSPYKDLVFSHLLLEDPVELDLVQRMHSELWVKARKPDLTVYLDIDPGLALERIHGRGRPFEQGIGVSYLESLRAGYMTAMEHLGREVVTIPVTDQLSPEQVADRVIEVATARDSSWSRST